MTLKIDLSNHAFTKDTSIAKFKLHAEYNTSNEQEKAIENLKVVPGDYEVVVSQKKFLHFKNEGGLQYWLALDRSSEI